MAVALLVTAVLFSSGCGDGESDKTGNTAAPTVATGGGESTGATGDASSEKSDDDASTSKDQKKSGSSSEQRPESPPTPEQKALESEVTTAFNRLMKAYRDRDYDYVCTRAYSTDYIAELKKRGGCKKVVEEEVGSVKSFSGSVKGMSKLNNDAVQVSVVLRITPKSGAAAENDTTVHFKKQAGEWKYFIFTGNNG